MWLENVSNINYEALPDKPESLLWSMNQLLSSHI